MKRPIDSEGIDQLIGLIKGYVRDSTEENLGRINEKLNIIGETIGWARSYLEQLESTGNENGLKTHAQKFLYYARILSRYMVLERQMNALQKMNIFRSPYSVSERLKRMS